MLLFATRFLVSAICVLLTVFSAWAIEPDDYLGDSAIYTGAPSERPTPNVLLVIDTSRATLSRAAGNMYSPSTSYSSPENFVNSQVYVADNSGQFDPSRPLGGNSAVTLADVSCVATYTIPDPNVEGETITKTVDPNSILGNYGSYSGAGSDKFPNLAVDGSCETAPKGAVYATGNYLNFINSHAALDSDAVIIEHTYLYVKNPAQSWIVTERFQLIKEISVDAGTGAADASMEPGVGSDWELYWTKLPPDDTRDPTFPVDSQTGAWDGTDGWSTGNQYILPTGGTYQSQREAFFDALVPVLNGASPSVNFGFLTYNPNNQGAVLGHDITAFGEDPSDLIAALPGPDRDGDGDLEDEIPSVIASGPNRPQSEALYDAGYYFMVDNGAGYQAAYKKTDGTSPSQQSVNLTASDQIPSNINNPCGYNHIIFLTNGLPNQDTGTPDLGDWDSDGYGDESVYGAGSHYMDDVAYYLHNEVDINGDGEPGDLTIHTILAFQTEDELLRNTAEDGGGKFYNVFDTNGLTKALQDILSGIVSESDTAFVAPVVPASTTNRTISSNRVYLGLFKPQTNAPWHGNLKKYKVSSANVLLDVHGNPATDSDGDFIYSQSYWGTGTIGGEEKILSAEEGTRNVVPSSYDPSTGSPDSGGGDGGIVDAGGVGGTLMARDLINNPRKIITYLTSSNSSVSAASSNLMAAQNRLLPEPAAATNPWPSGNSYLEYDTTFEIDAPDAVTGLLHKDKLVSYMHGLDAFSTAPLAKRNWILGDILHSKPLVFNYSHYSDSEENTCYDPASPSAPYNSTVIFVGANDGMLHAFADCSGEELWAFVPPMLLPRLKNLPEPGHEYFVDAPPSLFVHDAEDDGVIQAATDKVILVFGLRRGGGNAYLSNDSRGAYYALDVTNPSNPQFLWELSADTTGFSELGETWSQPRIAKIKDGSTVKVVMFAGAGYDNNEDRRWGNTQGFPNSSVSSPIDTANDTDTTVATDDGNAGVGNAGVTSDSSGSQLNPRGRGLYAVEVARLNPDGNGDYAVSTSNTGSVVWSYTRSDDNNMTFSIPSDLAVLDWDGDSYADRIYVGDTGGQMWRFSLEGTDKSQWDADVIFRSNPGYANDTTDPANQTADGTEGRKIFYRPSVARYGDEAFLFFGTGDRAHPLNLASSDRLYMVIDRGQGTKNLTNGVKGEDDLVDVTQNFLQNSTDTSVVQAYLDDIHAESNYGWYIRLENDGEKMLAPPVVFFGQVFFTTYAPLVGTVSTCEVGNLGQSRLYHLDYRTGEAVFNYDTTNDSGSDALADDSRAKGDGYILRKTDRVRDLGEGIPSGIVTLIDASGKVTMMISASNRVGTYAAPDAKLITPVYWMQWNQ